MASTRILIAALAGTAVALSACGGNEEAAPGAPAATAPDGSMNQPVAADGAPAQTSLWRGGEVAPLDIQVAHPNGVVLQLTSLQSRQTETVVGVRILNGATNEIQLNRFNNRQGYIVVDSGERIYISPPAGNTTLAVQPGQTLEGELIFLGRLPRAQSAVLVLNENSASDNRYSRTPGFRIDLPLSTTGSQEAEAAS
ncbi:MAG: hypothetical protein ACK4FB_03300 [Brevundimonas sp.]|uniref:hypothetical protein n=1 Tax=Brevundimonas sp. TaxID=1871086 RepID=UPI0039193A0F